MVVGGSVYDSRLSFFSQSMETKPFIIGKEEHQNLTCCEECTSNFQNELLHLKSFHSKQLPSWLQSPPKVLYFCLALLEVIIKSLFKIAFETI